MRLVRVISGGQTGVDRGALEAARKLDFPHGGWYPKGSRCEDNVDLGDLYSAMVEHKSPNYPPRTACNVRDSDVTLIIHRGNPMGAGTKLTFKLVEQYKKPLVEVCSDGTSTLSEVCERVTRELEKIFGDEPFTMNVAGPRASSWPEGAQLTEKLVSRLIASADEGALSDWPPSK